MANEKWLIDASFENAKEVLEKVPYYPDEIWKFAAMAKRFPTVDAVEVVHGKWAIFEDGWNDEVIYECTVCKEAFVTIDGTPAENLWNYCPNCGAKMDGDGNGAEC